LAKTDPSKLNTNEKMYAAALNPNLKEKEAIYEMITKDNASQNDWRAHNNFAILLINDYLQTADKLDLTNAQSALDKANAISPNNGIVLNNLGIAYFLEGKKEDAKKAFEASQKAQIEPVQQNYNLGIFKISEGDYNGVLQATGNRSCDYTVALAQLLNKDYAAAKSSIDCVQPKDAKAFYLAAVIGARQKNETEAINNLSKAIDLDKSYISEAKKDAEFKRLKSNPEFKRLLGL
jgi:Flp pilus assembly protein TadD